MTSSPQQQVTRYFDDTASSYFAWYGTRTQEGHSFRIRKQRVLESLSTFPHGATVVDVGCGPGIMIRELLERGMRVIATDIAPEMIKECTRLFPARENLTLAIAPAEHLPIADASADALLAMGLVEYLADDAAVLREFARVLKPGGILVVTIPHYWSPSRVWNRITKWIARPIVQLVRAVMHHTPQGVIHREYRIKTYERLVETSGFRVTDVVFYNMKIFFRPLDALFPSLGVTCSEALERNARRPFFRRLGTGCILVAKKF